MTTVTFLYLIFLAVSVALSAPTENGFVVSTERPSKEGNQQGVINFAPIIYEMNIKSNVSNRFAKTLIASKVRNPGNESKEATFAVVLPEKAFISEFVMEIGEKSYKAYVKGKEEAKDIYDKAVASGQSAGHVAVSARNSNRFTVSINLEAGSKATFLLTYEELLQRKFNQYELVLNIQPGQIVKKLNVEVHINETRPLVFVRTPSLRTGNEISKNKENLDPSSDVQIINSTSAVVKFAPGIEKQKEFARNLGTKESDGLSGQFIVQYDVERDPLGGEVLLQDGYFVHFFAPDSLELLPKHVVFVLDTSSSMHGTKIEQLKEAMKSILKEMKNSDILSIVEFNSYISVWDIKAKNTTRVSIADNYHPFNSLEKIPLPKPISIDESTRANAIDVVDKLQPTSATNIIGGLETGLYLIKKQQESSFQKEQKLQPIVVFLTDGEPNVAIYSTSEITKVATALNLENNKVPIFSLSFGSGANKNFLRELSLKNFGFSRHIYEASDASLQLQEFYKQISSPALSNVTFIYQSEAKELTKTHFPLFFQGSELVVSGRYNDESFLPEIGCWGRRGRLHLRPTVYRPVTSLERLWAYLTVQQTLEQRNTAENKIELTKKALDLALKYSFVTEVTSLVVVKPNATSAVDPEEATKMESRHSFGSGRSYGFRSYLHSAHTSPNVRSFRPRFGGGGFYINSGHPSYNPYRQEAIIPNRFYDMANSIIPTTTITTLGTTSKPSLNDELPWLASSLNSDGKLTVSQGTYEIGENATVINTDTECPMTPLNDTKKGLCTLLKDCPEVYPSLINFQTYQTFFCPIANKYAGVCCPKKNGTN